jgi:hypothetical protein
MKVVVGVEGEMIWCHTFGMALFSGSLGSPTCLVYSEWSGDSFERLSM